MATGFLSPIGNSIIPFFTSQGVVLSGGQLFTYLAGTTTPAATYTTSTLSVANPNPIVLGSNGLAPQEIWLQQGSNYKFVLEDANSNVLATYDNITGINDISSQGNPSEWIISGVTPTYVSGTQFTVPGNLVSTFTVGRRVYASVSAGTVYGTITASSFGSPNTTVTIIWDSGALDSGLTQVAYALLNSNNVSVPAANNSFTSIGQDTGAANFRAINGNYGVILKNDGTSAFLEQTASGSQYGAANAFRPFQWLLATGAVTIDATGIGTSFGGAASFTGLIKPTSNVGISGTLTNDSAPSGSIGEFAEQYISSITAFTTSNVVQGVASVTLSAGDWDLEGSVFFIGSNNSVTYSLINCGINTVNTSLPGSGKYVQLALSFSPSSNQGLCVPRTRMSLAGSTTVFLVASGTWSAGGPLQYQCDLTARRVR